MFHKFNRLIVSARFLQALVVLTAVLFVTFMLEVRLLKGLKTQYQKVLAEASIASQLPSLRKAMAEREAAKVVSTLPPATPSQPSLILQGKVTQNGTTSVMINSQIYDEGAQVLGYTLVAIREADVILKNNATDEEKILRYPPPKKTVPMPSGENP